MSPYLHIYTMFSTFSFSHIHLTIYLFRMLDPLCSLYKEQVLFFLRGCYRLPLSSLCFPLLCSPSLLSGHPGSSGYYGWPRLPPSLRSFSLQINSFGQFQHYLWIKIRYPRKLVLGYGNVSDYKVEPTLCFVVGRTGGKALLGHHPANLTTSLDSFFAFSRLRLCWCCLWMRLLLILF